MVITDQQVRPFSIVSRNLLLSKGDVAKWQDLLRGNLQPLIDDFEAYCLSLCGVLESKKENDKKHFLLNVVTLTFGICIKSRKFFYFPFYGFVFLFA